MVSLQGTHHGIFRHRRGGGFAPLGPTPTPTRLLTAFSTRHPGAGLQLFLGAGAYLHEQMAG